MSSLHFLYKTGFGRLLLRPLISRPISELFGTFLDSGISKGLIGPFAKKNHIVLGDYLLDDIKCFNDFFCRKIKKERRPISEDPKDLIAPCDGLLSVYQIKEGTVLSVKQSKFKISRLLQDKDLADEFEGGYALVFRLCVEHYHRYVYFDSGKQGENRKIPGVYHTVRPVALEEYPVYVENTREYTVIDTDHFGKAVQMEVGAMLVGRIVNDHLSSGRVTRGQEKGHFAYGGSTVIILLSAKKAILRPDILKNLDRNREIPVIMGEVIGAKKDG